MEALLYHLEPRREEKDVILHNELDEVNEAIFFERGLVDIGFEINRKRHFVVRLTKDIQIGSYNITFDKRSRYIFKTKKACTGFSIRRISWKTVIMDEDFQVIAQPLKKIIKKEYDQEILFRVNKEKQRLIDKWGDRKDYDAMLRVVEHEDDQKSPLKF
jgi:hypothetical protein